jgi:hypothetical protein
MNKEEIEHMWKVASNDPNHDTNWHDPVVIRFAELVASAERSACANAMAYLVMTPTLTHGALVKLSDVVNAIRARGQA